MATTEFLAIAGALKSLPSELPPAALTLFFTAVEAKIRLLAVEAAIRLRRDANLSTSDKLQETRDQADRVLDIQVGQLSLLFADLVSEPGSPDWRGLIDKAAAVIDFQRLMSDAVYGAFPAED